LTAPISNFLGQDQHYNPDVLTCLANLSSDEVFTPPKIANDILDLLPSETWQNKDLRFLDPSTKTGIFLREITKRLMIGLQPIIPDDKDRLEHILKNQIYGIAITELTALMSRRTLYCSKNAASQFSIVKFEHNSGNIYHAPMSHNWKDDFCTECGASRSVYDRDSSEETYAYNYIHSNDLFKDIEFDVIIGGPPFQLYDGGGTGSSARPLYQKFVEKAIAQCPKYIAMVTPARWYSGGKGLDRFRAQMLSDPHMRVLVDFPETKDVFPTDIAGGICYFLWDREHQGKCTVRVNRDGVATESKRYLNEFDTLIRDQTSIEIINKVQKKTPETLDALVSSRKPFGFESNYKSSGVGQVTLRTSQGKVKVSSTQITAGHDLINKWKVLLSKASNDHGGQPDKQGHRKIFSRIEILAPNEICTESYLVIGNYESEKPAKNMEHFLRTKFCRFLVSVMLLTHNISRGTFKYVPRLPMDREWDDESLNTFYNLSDEQVSFINGQIKAME